MKTQNGEEEVRKKKGKGFENGGGGGEKENGKMEREGRANQDWDGFKISMVENVLAASVPASKSVSIERKQPWKNGPDTKGHGECVNVPLSRILKRATYPRFSWHDFSRYSDQ